MPTRICRLAPNHITILSLLIVLSSIPFYLTGEFFVGGWIMGVGSLLDAVDGHYARRTGQVSKRGAFLDSLLDRIGEFSVMFSLFLYFDSLLIRSLITATLFFCELVSYCRARAEGLGLECRNGLFPRHIRIPVLFIGSILGERWLIYSLYVLFLGSFLTVIQRTVYVLKMTAAEEK